MSYADINPAWLHFRAESQATGGVQELTWPVNGKGTIFRTTGSPPAVTPPSPAVIGPNTAVRIHRIHTTALNNSGLFQLKDWLSTVVYFPITLSNTTHQQYDLNIVLPSGVAVMSFPGTNANLGAIEVHFSIEE